MPKNIHKNHDLAKKLIKSVNELKTCIKEYCSTEKTPKAVLKCSLKKCNDVQANSIDIVNKLTCTSKKCAPVKRPITIKDTKKAAKQLKVLSKSL
jgi:hypothetical protein